MHTTDRRKAHRFAMEMPASRVLVNVPASHACGGLLSGLHPSFTLGCGTFGGNSTTDNVDFTHLLNVKRLARARFTNRTLLAAVPPDDLARGLDELV